MKKNDLISIIVPIYNAEKYIENCISSIQKQTYNNFEIIAIDDGSKDNSFSILKKIQKKDSRIKIFQQENFGVSITRNQGIEKASGEYICFIDSDDCISENYLEILYKNMLNTHSDVSMCAINECRIYKETIEEISNNNERIIEYDNISFLENIFDVKKYSGFVCNKLYKKSIIGKNRFDSTIFMNEDLLFNIQISSSATRYCFSEKKLYNYIIHDNSLSTTSLNEKKMTSINAYNKILKIISENEKKLLPIFQFNAIKNFIWLKTNSTAKDFINIKKLDYEINKLYKQIKNNSEISLFDKFKIVVKNKCYRLINVIKKIRRCI